MFSPLQRKHFLRKLLSLCKEKYLKNIPTLYMDILSIACAILL